MAYHKHSGTSITCFQIDFFAFTFCFPTGSYRCSDVVSISVQLTIQACMGSPSSADKISRLFTPALYERKKNLERSGVEQIDTL